MAPLETDRLASAERDIAPREDQHDDVAKDAERRKRLATLKAHLALRGFELHETSQGLLISKWGLTRHVIDVDGGEAFLRQVGGSA